MNQTIRRAITVLRDAPRQGADRDEPEGSRYIQISDTLANELADQLRGLITDD